MISETAVNGPQQAYVWIWLTGAQTPVVAGLLRRQQPGGYTFAYGRSYLQRPDAMSLFPDELPLRAGSQRQPDDALPSCLRDAAPDAWGHRVIIHRLTGRRAQDVETIELDDLTYLLESGSDRIGALDFQASPSTYRPRESIQANLDDLATAAERVEH
jgi:serine/threonine-protein kinase HipA